MGSIQQVNSAMGAARPGLPGWKLILALGKLGLQKRVPHLVRLLFATTASLLVWRWMQNILGPRKEKTMGMKAKDLATAPSLNKFHFFWSNKGIAEVLISEFKRFSDSGSNLGCIWFGSKKFVVATHPKTAKEILTNGKVFKKANVLTFLESPIRVFYTDENDKRLPDMPMSNDIQWYQQRKHFNPCFTSDALENLIPKFWCEAEVFAKNCAAPSVPVVDRVTEFALDCLGTAVLGRSFGAQGGGFKETYDAYMTVVGCMGDPLTNLFPSLFKLPLERNRKVFKAAAKIKELLVTSYEQKLIERKQGVTTPDGSKAILDFIIEASEEQKNFPKESIIPNLWTFFIAGHDTTATSLAWLINVFAQYPEVQQRVRDEIKAVFGTSTKPPTLAQLNALEYLDAVLKENLRLNPPIHNLATRECVKDTVLDGYFVEKGTQVSIAIQAVNTHEAIWEDAHLFKPERFLNREPEKTEAYNWLSFSVGARGCIGNKFSLIEQKCLIAQLLLNYDIKPEHGPPTKNHSLPLSNSSISFLLKQPQPYTLNFKALHA